MSVVGTVNATIWGLVCTSAWAQLFKRCTEKPHRLCDTGDTAQSRPSAATHFNERDPLRRWQSADADKAAWAELTNLLFSRPDKCFFSDVFSRCQKFRTELRLQKWEEVAKRRWICYACCGMTAGGDLVICPPLKGRWNSRVECGGYTRHLLHNNSLSNITCNLRC